MESLIMFPPGNGLRNFEDSSGEKEGVISTVDLSKAVVKIKKPDWSLFIPKDELAIKNDDAEEDIDTIDPQFFSPTIGMATIENIFDGRLSALIQTDSNGTRFFEFCQRYENGSYSSKISIEQADLYRLAFHQFNLENFYLPKEKKKAEIFISRFIDEYFGKMAQDEIIEPLEILKVLFSVRSQLPVKKADSESVAEQLYRRILDIFANEMKSNHSLSLFKKQAYYVLFRDDMMELAKYLQMPISKVIKELAQNNLLYCQNSSMGYQTKVNIGDGERVYAYCIYDFNYMSRSHCNNLPIRAEKPQT